MAYRARYNHETKQVEWENGLEPPSRLSEIDEQGFNSSVTGRFSKPIEMMSVAVNTDADIADFRKRNPNIQISGDRRDPNYGIPIAHTRQEKLSVLRNEGFCELN